MLGVGLAVGCRKVLGFGDRVQEGGRDLRGSKRFRGRGNMQATQTRRGTSGLHTVNSWRQRRCARGAGSQVSTAAP